MGYSSKKTAGRDEVSGIMNHVDVPDGTWSVNELRNRNDARQELINSTHKSDWTAGSTLDHPAYGNALSRLSKPSDAVAGSLEHYGSGQTAPPKTGGTVQKNNKPAVKGLDPATKGRG